MATNGVDTIFDTCTVYVAAANAGPDLSICAGDTTQLQASAGAAGYTWTPSTGLSSATVANPSAWPSTTTDYQLAALYQVQNFSRTCYDTATITVNPLPQPSLGPDITVCQGAPVTLNPGAGFATYQWSTSATTPTLSVTQSGQYWVDVKNSFNCEGSDTVQVTFIPYPVVTVVPQADTICIGDTLTIKALSTISPVTWTWSNGSLADSTVVSPVNPTTYYVTVTHQGCSRVDSSKIHTKHVPDPYCYASGYTLCEGDSTTIQVVTLYPGTTYQWSSGHTTSTIHVSPSTSTTYGVTATLNGCSGDTSITIEVNPIPQIQVTASPPSVCLGDSTKLTATSTVWGTQFSWSTGGTGPQTGLKPSVPVNVIVTGTVNNCTSSDSVQITLKNVPDLQLVVSDDTICAGDSVTLTGTSTTPGVSFLWSTGAVVPQITEYPYVSTIYIVIATLNGCYSDSTVVVEVFPVPQLQVTPNPIVICDGEDEVVTVTSDIPGTTFSWSNGMTGSPVTITPTTSTTLSVTGNTGFCGQTAWVNVTVTPIPTVSLGEDGYICEGEPVTLTPTGNYLTLEWWDGSTAPQNAIHQPGTYWVKAFSGDCETADSVFYDECPTLFVPNAFTPNSDGVNDKFHPVHTSIDIKSIYVYSRWGSLVFFTGNPEDQWDGTHNGKPCAAGVYYYVIRYFNPKTDLHQEKAGSVQLLR